MTNTIYATFTDPEMAKKAAGALLDHGVRSEHITVVFGENYGIPSHNDANGQDVEHTAATGITTTTPGDATSGAAKGAGLGLAAGALAALASVFIPGVGLVLGGGALAIAIGGAAGSTAAGAVAGGVTGYLKDQGVSEEEIQTYGTNWRNGGALISVFPTDEKLSAKTLESVLAKYDGRISLGLFRNASLI